MSSFNFDGAGGGGFKRLQAAQFLFFFSFEIFSTCDGRPLISTWTQATANPFGVGQGRTNVDDGLEDIRRIHGLGGESLAAASYALFSNPKKQKLFFAIRDRSRNSVIGFAHTSGRLLCYHTPDQRPPRVTGHCVSTVALAWVGAPNERTLSRIHEAVVSFVDRRLAKTGDLAAWNFRLSFEADLGPTSAADLGFSGLFQKFGSFRWKNRAHEQKFVLNNSGGCL